jgi:crotonyl-CoA carboxylase/reductase
MPDYRARDLYEVGELPPLGVVPPQMYAWTIRRSRHGEPESAMKVEVVQTWPLGRRDVLVLVLAAGINYNGIWASLGNPVSVLDVHKHQFHIAGSEAAGIVWAVGDDVTSAKVGDEVVIYSSQDNGTDLEANGGDPLLSQSQRAWGYETPDGSFAQFCRVQERQILARPKHLTWEESAAYLTTLATAYRMLLGHPPHVIRPGCTVLVWGAAGGLGVYAIQLIKMCGGRAIAIASTEERGRYALQLGAIGYINRSEYGCCTDLPTEEASARAWYDEARKFGRAVRAIAGQDDVDIVFDHAGRETFAASCFLVKRGGMVVFCGATSGFRMTFDARYVWMRQKRIQGSHYANLKQAAEANALVMKGRITPCLGRVFEWQGIPAAHALMQRNAHPAGNMAALVNARATGLRSFAEVVRQNQKREEMV